jgi:hypothetical protein
MLQDLEYLFILLRKVRIFFPEFNIRLYDKNSESDYFFFPPPKSEYFFQQHWESEYFFRKKNHNPPFKLNSRSLMTCLVKTCVYFPLLSPRIDWPIHKSNKGNNHSLSGGVAMLLFFLECSNSHGGGNLSWLKNI